MIVAVLRWLLLSGWLWLLDADHFAAREAATRRLAAAGEHARPFVLAGLASGKPEAVARCQRILDAWGPDRLEPPTPYHP